VASLVLLVSASDAFAAIGWKYYLVFLIMTAIGAVIFGLFFPEVSKCLGPETEEPILMPWDRPGTNLWKRLLRRLVIVWCHIRKRMMMRLTGHILRSRSSLRRMPVNEQRTDKRDIGAFMVSA
jgi:hypothetical protein